MSFSGNSKPWRCFQCHSLKFMPSQLKFFSFEYRVRRLIVNETDHEKEIQRKRTYSTDTLRCDKKFSSIGIFTLSKNLKTKFVKRRRRKVIFPPHKASRCGKCWKSSLSKVWMGLSFNLLQSNACRTVKAVSTNFKLNQPTAPVIGEDGWMWMLRWIQCRWIAGLLIVKKQTELTSIYELTLKAPFTFIDCISLPSFSQAQSELVSIWHCFWLVSDLTLKRVLLGELGSCNFYKICYKNFEQGVH